MGKSHTVLLVGLLGAAFLAAQTFFIVPETRQALVLQFGNPVAQYTDPGLKAKIPFIQQVRVFDSRVLDVDPKSEEIILSDQKRLVVDTFARYRISDMLKFYQTLGVESSAAERLQTLINSTLRSTLGNVTVLDVLSEKRAGIMEKIRKEVNASVQRQGLGIEIVDVRIGRADLPQQTSKAIYERMISERVREAAEFRAQGQEQAQQIRSKADKEKTVLLAEAEKQAQMTRGQGDAQASRIYAEAFRRDPEFYAFYRSLEAYRASLANPDTTIVISPDSEFFKYFGDTGGARN